MLCASEVADADPLPLLSLWVGVGVLIETGALVGDEEGGGEPGVPVAKRCICFVFEVIVDRNFQVR